MIIEMPDGIKVTFPDDMPKEKIKGMIAKKYPDFAKQFQPKNDAGMDFISKEGEESIANEFGDDKIISKMSGLDAMSDSGLNVGTMSKIDAMLSIAKFAANKDKRLEFIKPAITTVETFKNTDYSKLGSEALKSAGRQTTSLIAGGTGFYVKNAGRLLHNDSLTEEDFNDEYAKTNPVYHLWKANQAVSDTLVKFGDSLEDLEKKVNDSDILRADEGLFEGSFEENPNLHKVVDLAMSGVSSLAGMYTISKVTNPAVGLYFMSGVDAKDVFEESLEAGNSKLKTVGLWGAATLGTAQLEKFGFEKVFNVKISSKGMKAIIDSSKKTSEKILEGVLSEGAEEGLQTVWQNTIAKIGYDETRNIFQNAVESAIGGALGGGLVSSFNFGIQSFNKKAKKAGLNEQEQTNILNNVAQSIADNPDLVDVPFQENMKKTYDSFSKMIAEMEDSPEKQRLIATKEALDTGYQKYYDEFKSYMPEEQAKANANLLRSSALFFSDLEGISVDEWFKTKAPQIRRMSDLRSKAKEFIDSVTPTKLKLDENEIDLFEALKNPDLVKKYEEKDTRQSLTQFIKRNGGVKDVGGDLKAMDIGKQIIGVINNKGGNSLDDVALSAWENGYFPEMTERPTVNDLLDAIREESFGKKRYAGEKKQGIGDYVETLAQNLDMLGINYQNMTPREIEKAYNEALDKYNQSVSVDEMQEPVEDFGFMDNEYFQMANENAQLEQNPLGAYANRIIYINDNANASTLPHELAHFWSDELKRSKSLRAKEILRQADIWENKEFDRKYKIEKQENGYVVTDKSGKTIYDRMGEGFRTEEQAKAYAKEELFARGFEKYIKEGKAPSKTLRVVFANFYNWLKKIYSDMLSLDIKLSKPMRELYSNILGSTNIDVFLDSDVDNFIEQREQAEEQKEKIVQNIIDKAPVDKSLTLPEKIRKAYEEFDFGESWKKAIIPLSTRAKRVAPTLRNKIRRFEFDLMETKQNYYRQTEPLMRKWNKFSKEDAIAFDLALKNGAVEIRDRILRKYNAVADFEKVKAVLEDIYYKANDAGLDVGYIEDYFPRKIIDKDGLMSYLHGTEEWSSYQQALQREDPHNQFTAEEQAEFLDKFLRGVVRADVAAYKYSSEKARKLDIIDNTLNQYYADSMQALISYIDGMNARISTVNFFGRNRENVDESIGEFVAYLLNNNKIKPSQVDEVKSILNAVFKRAGVRQKWIKGLRDMAYIYTMGGVNTAITQIDDIFVAAYKGGVLNTIQSAFSKDRVTKKDLGLDSIAAEFMNSSGTSKLVNWVFTHNGIELIDGFGKNSLLNGVLKKMEKMSDKELREYIEPIMEEETEQTIRDVRNGELSANVRFFLFNELSDMQPVSLSELPEIYNVGGNARIFYMLKSFMLKRIDTIRNECYDKIRSNNKAERVEGWQNLYKLVLLMMIGGATKDLLIDLMYNRVIDISDTVVNNLLGMIGISKYNIYQVREEGFGHTISIFVTPPLLQVADDLAGDVNKYLQGKRELKDFEVFKGLPIIGRFYYWLAGGGKTKMEKKKKRGA